MPETINFQSEIGAGATESLKYELTRAGRLRRIYVEAVLGEEADVERSWFINDGNSRKNVLLEATDGTINSEGYLAGDDTQWDLPVNQAFDEDDVLVLEVNNTDANNAYPTIAVAEVAFGRGN